MQVGKLNPLGKINFPGFQEILDFTATGSESSVSVSVNGDTDKEYIIGIANLDSSRSILVRLNNDSGTNYGYQYIRNSSGSISAARSTNTQIAEYAPLETGYVSILTPSGFIKTAYSTRPRYTSGTTMQGLILWGGSWNSTVNVTSLNFVSDSTVWLAGTRIVVYARRSQL